MKRLLITGAAGILGRLSRERLTHLADSIRLSDIAEMEAPRAREETVVCDLADFAAVCRLVEDCDGIIHLGGLSQENSFHNILQANIVGTYNLYEAARLAGVPRILFASSNHAMGFHLRETRLGADAQPRPDSLYGTSKCYGEALARLYYDKFEIETAIVRIGSCFPEPRNPRELATWLSPDDFVSLVECVFRVPRLGCPVIYGVSDNDERWWDNSHVAWLGWRPKDNAENFRSRFTPEELDQDRNDPKVKFQGGAWINFDPFPQG